VNPAFGTNIPAKAERTGKKVEFLRIFLSWAQVGGQCVRTATENKVKSDVQFD